MDKETLETISWLQETIRDDPEDWRSSLRLAVLLEQHGQTDGVAPLYECVLRHNPGHSRAAARLAALASPGAAAPTPVPEATPAAGAGRLAANPGDITFLFKVVAIAAAVLVAALLALSAIRTHRRQMATGLSQFTTGGGIAPAWSPDGTRLAYVNNGTVWARETGAGAETRLLSICDSATAASIDWTNCRLAWSPDGQLLAVGSPFQTMVYDLWSGMIRSKLPPFESSGQGAARTDGSWLAWQPRGRWMAYVTGQGLFVQRDGAPPTQLRYTGQDRFPTYLPDGRSLVLYTDVSYLGGNIMTSPNASPGLLRLTIDGDTVHNVSVILREPGGRLTGLASSSDGSRLAYTAVEGGFMALWVLNSDGSNLRRISKLEDGFIKSYPAWSPAGDKIAVAIERSGIVNIWIYAI